MKSVLIIGGGGYIGSHMVKMMAHSNYEVTAFDNLSRGHRDAVVVERFVRGDLLQGRELAEVFRQGPFEVVLHFAALCYVGESVMRPREYYQNNVTGTLNLLNAMLDAGVKNIVFSSSCATYGVPERTPITEGQPQNPINPYGQTKLIVERVLGDYATAYGMNSISLRYFNAAGCDPDGALGERHDPETHLIPLILREADRIRRGGKPQDTKLCVYGDDFDTPDGTCIRDYIHVHDLCVAHLSAVRRLISGEVAGAEAYNLGNGQGFSVKQVIDACRRVTGADIRYKTVGRRAGDPPRLVGSAEKARAVLCWQPQITDLEAIIATAWRWCGSGGM
jgi:UDP-glucose 4-epimerase